LDKKIKPVSRLSGSIEVPGDKSISHRALILGAICPGKVSITNLSSAADCSATAECLKSIGVKIEKKSASEMIVYGDGDFTEPSDILDAHNSGTTVRLLSGLLAAQPFHTVITGDSSLRNRPMKRIIDPLIQMGARITAREKNTMLPMSITGGKIKSIEYTPPMASAQVKSAILIAGLYGDNKTIVNEKLHTRDHTERMLEYLGCDIEYSPKRVILGNGKMEPQDIVVAGDISSAAFFIVAGVLSGDSSLEINNVGLNPSRTGCLKTLIDMGAEIEIEEIGVKSGEPIGNVEVRSSGRCRSNSRNGR
jgi:3-phosphoshikimate 1-carboxyvinyltransferase